jgi:hypothetical protein
MKPLATKVETGRLTPADAYLEPTKQELHPLFYPSGSAVRRAGDLQRTLRALQQLVNSPGFRPWLYYIATGRGGLTYLHPDHSQRAELERWLQRCPLIGHFTPELAAWPALPHRGIVVPVRVEAYATKDNAPEGAFVRDRR